MCYNYECDRCHHYFDKDTIRVVSSGWLESRGVELSQLSQGMIAMLCPDCADFVEKHPALADIL